MSWPFQIAYEWDFRILCTVTFGPKVDFLNSNADLNSRLYGMSTDLCGHTTPFRDYLTQAPHQRSREMLLGSINLILLIDSFMIKHPDSFLSIRIHKYRCVGTYIKAILISSPKYVLPSFDFLF